ncbi:MAG: tRNA (adenosine(37)-N6)-dimethylallyltransferase MiaA [Acidimicrobiales bacterium]
MGPTACGKSALAVLVAQELGDVEIVSADSMQVYREMDIGTAKMPTAQRGGIVHHLIDVADPGEEWDVVRFTAAARRALGDIEERGRRALFVGGTGLYLHALIDDFAVPGRWPGLWHELDEQADTSALHRRLEVLDPVGAARVEVGNRRRVLRALEVTLGSGRPFSSFGPGVGAFPPTSWRLAGVWLPRHVVARRIDGRLAAMMGAGFLEEVRSLAQRPGGLSRTARQALGYRELLAHLEGETTLADAEAEAVRRTRQFSRRQRMWWRRDPRVRWFGAPENPLAVLPALLGDWKA